MNNDIYRGFKKKKEKKMEEKDRRFPLNGGAFKINWGIDIKILSSSLSLSPTELVLKV